MAIHHIRLAENKGFLRVIISHVDICVITADMTFIISQWNLHINTFSLIFFLKCNYKYAAKLTSVHCHGEVRWLSFIDCDKICFNSLFWW